MLDIKQRGKKRNRTLIFILLFSLITNLSNGVTSHAEETNNLVTGKCGNNVFYELNKETGVLRIYGTGPMDDYKKYTTSSPWDKEYRSMISKVQIEYGVTTIGNDTFYGNPYFEDTYYKNLTTVEIASTVTDIGRCAFLACKNLKSVVIPNSVRVIGDSAFSGTGLIYVDWGNSVETIGTCAFSETGLTELNLPSSTQFIGNGAFSNCQRLKSVEIPDNCEISNQVFVGCNVLNNVAFGENCRIHGEIFNKCSQLSQITLGEGCISVFTKNDSVDRGVFYGCTGLKSILLPDSWDFYDGSQETYAYSNQFVGCTNLQNISFKYTNNKYVTIDEVVYSKDKKVLVYYPSWLMAEEYEMPENVITIAPGAFMGQKYLQHVQFSPNVNKIGWGAFRGCSKLNNVILPEEIVELTGSVFASCSVLKKIVWPNSLNKIDLNGKSGTHSFFGTDLDVIYGEIGSYAEEWAGDKFHETIYCSFDANGGVVDTKKQAVIFGDKYWKLPNPEREGYRFLGWYTQKEQGNKITSDTLVSEEISHTLYAHWITDVTTPKSINDTEITLETTRYTYDGTEKEPTVNIKDGSVTLTKGVDYTISYADNVKVGVAKVIITGIGNYTGTASKTFIISEEQRDFVWEKDNWNFNNSSYQGYFSSSKMIEQIDSTYLSVLKNNLTNSEYRAVFDELKGWLYDDWGGSCYGMSSTSLLAMENILPYSEYKLGATALNQLDYPVENSKVSSLITYYQMLQVKDIIQQQYRTIPNKTHKENIQSIISQLDTNNTVLVCFKKEGWGAHAVLAYDYEYGSYTWNGVTYQGCIKICDPNSSKQYKKECNIYFNTNSFNWTIPYYSHVPITSVSGAKIMYAGADIDAINCGGYLSGTTDIKFANFVARIDAAAVANNRSVTKVKEVDGNYVIESNAPGDIVEDFSFVPGGESEGTIGYNLYDANASYQLSQNKAEKLQLSMDYEDCYLEGGSAAGNKIVFDKNGYVSVLGESADYNIAMTFDDKYPTDWFTIQVNGENSNEISLEKEDNGYVLSGDNLENVEINVNNKEDSAYAKFTTKYSSAYIYEVDENKIGVKVDTDYNGTYETVLDIVNSAGDSTAKPSGKPSTPPEASSVPSTVEPSILPSSSIKPSALPEVPSAPPTTEPSAFPSAPGVHSTAKPLVLPPVINATADPSDNYSDMGDLANHEEGTVEVGKTVVIKKLKYKITKLNKTGEGEVALMGTAEKKAGQKLKSIKIRNTVTIHKMSFKVTSIGKNAFSGCRSLKSVVLGKNITTIGNRAFYGCRHLKSIEIKSKKLKAGSIGKKAFWGITKDAKIKMPKKKKKAYQKWLKKKGITKSMKIK